MRSETGGTWRRVEERSGQGRRKGRPCSCPRRGDGRRSPGVVASRWNDAHPTGERRPIRGEARHEACGIPGTSAVDFERAWRRWLQPALAVLRRRRSDTPAPPLASDSITNSAGLAKVPFESRWGVACTVGGRPQLRRTLSVRVTASTPAPLRTTTRTRFRRGR